MNSEKKRKAIYAALVAGAGLLSLSFPAPSPAANNGRSKPAGGSGDLMMLDRQGQVAGLCPLRHTDVQAEISGPLARVTVTQDFENPSAEKIEAIYTFPLPSKAAVDDMTMTVGDRVIKGSIKRREEAREIYERARNQGQVAALLDQERPNIFTQAVTNIVPGARVKIVISYVETVPYDGGQYSFSFPMVVGPRYIPGGGRVPDASRITPPITPPATRAGHDVSVTVKVDAGVAIESLASSTHGVDVDRPAANRAVVRLKNQNEIPNRDFILSYDVAGKSVADAVLTHRAGRGGFFMLMLQPPERVTPAEVTPKELVFVVDTSGSMSGFPIEKSKEVIKLALDGMNPRDTFNLITFAGDTHVLFPRPVPATPANVRQAQQFLLSRSGAGGTEMMKAIRAALDPSDQQDHVRIVCFLTDGYVGNDMEIIGEVKKHPNARVFSFGIGSSVNRFLLDKMADEGRGEVEYVGLNDDGSAAARRFHDRVRNPLLTDISVEWNGLSVADVTPAQPADLFAAKPLVIVGRYNRAGQGRVRLRGKRAGQEWVREVAVRLPENEPQHDVLATLWARNRVEDLMSEDWTGAQNSQMRGDLKEAIVQLSLKFRLMTQFTSFVAVEETTVTKGGVPTKVEVPVEMPHGVSYEGIFGGSASADAEAKVAFRAQAQMAVSSGGFLGRRREAVMAPAPTLAMPVPAPEPRQLPKTKPEGTSAKLDPKLASLAAGTMVEVKVWLTDDSAAVIAKLKQLGLSVTRQATGRIVYGRIDAGALAALAGQDAVLFVSKDIGQP
jgi:Ca-activated chloride channel family protein